MVGKEEKKKRDLLAQKRYRLKNKDKKNACSRAWHKKNPDKVKDKKLRYCFGITLNDYNEMFAQQNGCCLICGIHQTELKKTLHVDHNHETGKVRGLLCHNCNHGIGFFKDNPAFLTNAIDYLGKTDG